MRCIFDYLIWLYPRPSVLPTVAWNFLKDRKHLNIEDKEVFAMSIKGIKSDPDIATNVGVSNPYALAEFVEGRKIDWKNLKDKKQVLEDILATPYEELFDPKYEGPLYFGLKLNSKGDLERGYSEVFDVKVEIDKNDLDDIPEMALNKAKVLGDLGASFKIDDIANIQIQRVRLCNPYRIALELRVPDVDRVQRLGKVFPKEIINSIALNPELQGSNSETWTPDNAHWFDKGTFFNEAAEFFDPVQGAVANCYFIAALSAVAWASPYRISHMSRATGHGNQEFTNLIRFYEPDSKGKIDKEIEVTDKVPVRTSNNSFIYCRSSESGEIWPALYEKAFAKLVTGTSSDQPNILETGWGDCVRATAQLTGGKRYYYGNSYLTGDQIWNMVRSNCMSKRTFNPMTCWTYGTAPEGLDYSDANIVGSHCYTILGWDYHCNNKYLIVRNPWGSTEPTVGVRTGNVLMYDVSFWRQIQLADSDGTFAIDADVFQQYFRGIGVVK